MLVKEFMQTCTRRVLARVSDGLGGFTDSWTNGATFDGAIVKKAAAERKEADRATVYTSYTLTVPKSTIIAYHDVFKTSDGREFRVTSKTSGNTGDNTTPDRSSFALSQVDVEEFTE